MGDTFAGFTQDSFDFFTDLAQNNNTAWFKANRELKEEEFNARKASLDESAKKIVGELPAMTIISHWLDYEIATLMSNPQLGGAIDNTLFARAQRK